MGGCASSPPPVPADHVYAVEKPANFNPNRRGSGQGIGDGDKGDPLSQQYTNVVTDDADGEQKTRRISIPKSMQPRSSVSKSTTQSLHDLRETLAREDPVEKRLSARESIITTMAEFPKRNVSLPDYVNEEFKMKQYQARRGHRNSIVEYIESVRRIQNAQMMQRAETMANASVGTDNVKFLRRGGTYVHTSAGPVQFGLPPETIKDCMNDGLTLPSHYVLPAQRFDVQTGINVSEFEFPAYFNFFVLRRQLNLITTREVEKYIRTIFQETLLGPEVIDFPDDFSEHCPREAYPDLMRELKHFRKNPFEPGKELTVDTLLRFTYFENGVAKLDKGVEIVQTKDEYKINDGGQHLATVSGYVILSPPPLRVMREDAEEKEPFFVPPVFGITMLGNSHGFDAKGTTTGFVLWMNRRGIIIDPPPHSGAILKQDGIPSRMIHGIILTHCHADHDAGTFQKILEEGKITLYTTRVIKDSFMRKYSAIAEMPIEFLQKLFDFHDVQIGDRFAVYGGHLEFHYSLHAIPCVGFSAFCNGKSMIYSGDTFNDPEGIRKIQASGFINEARADSLINFPWTERTVILHEAGVPPIHTPMKTLTDLPEEVKERLYVVHVASKDIPADSGLKCPAVGCENTIIIPVEEHPSFMSQEILDLVTSIDLFEDFPISRAQEILQKCRVVKYHAGEVLIEQDSMGDTMYVIMMGVVSIEVNGNRVKKLSVGDHFGEMSIVTHLPRTATVRAMTELQLLEFTGREFMHLTRGTSAVDRLRHLGLMQREESWQCISTNTVLQQMSSTQKTYLQSILHKVQAKRGEVLWEQGQTAKFAVLVEHGAYAFLRATDVHPFQRGAFVGEMASLRFGSALSSTLVCVEDGTFYYITKRMLLKFFDDNPGVLLYFNDRRFVE